MSVYVVPAAQPLSIVHLRDQNVPSQLTFAADRVERRRREEAGIVRVLEYTAGSHTGRTLCGLDMLVDEQWTDATQLVYDTPFCQQCIAGGPLDGLQESLL